MKCTYTTANGRLQFEIEGDTDKKLFTTLAHIQEIFEERTCGCCKSEKIKFDHREFDGHQYYKMLCESCGATLDMGQYKTGDALFAKKWDKEAKKALPNGGWYHYNAAVPAPMPSTNRVTKPAPKETANTKQAAAAPAKPKAMTPEEAHKAILKTFDTCTRIELLDQWAKWGADNYDFTDEQQDEQSDHYHAGMERLAGPVMQDIPF